MHCEEADVTILKWILQLDDGYVDWYLYICFVTVSKFVSKVKLYIYSYMVWMCNL